MKGINLVLQDHGLDDLTQGRVPVEVTLDKRVRSTYKIRGENEIVF